MLSSVRKLIISQRSTQVASSALLCRNSTQPFSSQAKFAKFDYTDAFNFSSLLTEEEKMVSFLQNNTLKTFFQDPRNCS